MNGKWLTAVLILAVATDLPAAAPPAVRLDHFGDSLPVGAVARLGSMRLRHLTAQLDVSPDGSQVASMDVRLRLWDRASGRLLREFDQDEIMLWTMAFAPDGKKVLSSNGVIDHKV